MSVRQFCHKGQHTCTPAVTLTFDEGARRLHWCAEHAADADAYRVDADGQRIDGRGLRLGIGHVAPATIARAYDEALAEQDLMPRPVHLGTLDNGAAVDEIRAEWRAGDNMLSNAIWRLMTEVGVSASGAEALLHAESTASLADGC